MCTLLPIPFNAHPAKILAIINVLTICVSLEGDLWHLVLNWYICKWQNNVVTPTKKCVESFQTFTCSHYQ